MYWRTFMYHILMLDDHPQQLMALQLFLENKGCKVSITNSISEANNILSNGTCHLLLLDVDMPNKNGFEACVNFQRTAKIPVVFLSNFAETTYQLQGFEAGGIDYITKDCPLELFWAKIYARLTLADTTPSFRKYPPLTLDLLHQKAFIDEENLNLTQTEFLLLSILSSHPGKIWSADALYKELFDDNFSNNTTLVQMHLSRMRTKLTKAFPQHDFIETVWGKGYQFIPTDSFF